jgi:hypothetical protein
MHFLSMTNAAMNDAKKILANIKMEDIKEI